MSPPEEQIPQFRRDYVAKMDKHLAARVRGFYVQPVFYIRGIAVCLSRRRSPAFELPIVLDAHIPPHTLSISFRIDQSTKTGRARG